MESGPRYVVQIGVSAGDVKVAIASTLSPPEDVQLACANPGQVEMLSPIIRNYVNYSEDSAPAPALDGNGDSRRSDPIGDPTPVGEAQESLGVSVAVKGESGSAVVRKKGQRRRLLMKGVGR